ncbi:MAG: FAD-dependent oxidoreductase [Myxococcales bacterium]|jgi:predicted NAD/FAD-binding protein
MDVGTGGGEGKPSGARVAVIGGGISGLAAAYRLGARHHVTLYERHREPGLAIHGVALAGAGERVDIPLRVFTEGHYRNLLALYAELGVETETIAHSSAYAVADAEGRPRAPFLRYGVGPEGTAQENEALDALGRRVTATHGDFVRMLLNDTPGDVDTTLGLRDYLRARGVPDEYALRFVVPSFAGICTCSVEAAGAFPADVALELLSCGIERMGLRKVRGGAAQASTRFLERLSDFRGGVEVQRVALEGERVVVEQRDGQRDRFDHVVIATQANHAARIADVPDDERALLQAVPYETVRVVVHDDDRLLPAPQSRGAWNFLVAADGSAASASIWVNALQPRMPGRVFQTVNPLREPDPCGVLCDLQLERALVSTDSAHVAPALQRLHAQSGRRLWFCGAYAARGVPLLEAGVTSALAVAAGIDAASEAAGRAR